MALLVSRLSPLLAPRSVAIVGASPRENTLGNNVLVNLRRFGYAGRIFPVHPSAPEVTGLPAYVLVKVLTPAFYARKDVKTPVRIAMGVLAMGVLPQVLPRFIGFGAYQLDSNLRNSTMVGIVGGGGIGAVLFTAYQRFDFDFVLTILLAIIALIMVAEILSVQVRRLFQ